MERIRHLGEELGISPLEAINLQHIGLLNLWELKKVGTISEGKQADIIGVKGDVLRYISLLQDVDLVIKKGQIYKNK